MLSACGGAPSGDSSSGADVSNSSVSEGDPVVTPEDGYAEGYLGDVIRTDFFDFSVDSAYTCAEVGSYTAPDNTQLLVVDITVENTSNYSMPMFDSDFQAQWGGTGDEDYSLPISRPIADNQAPASYEIPISGTATYTHVYEVPADTKDFSISFQEYYEDGSVGDMFFVYFTAPKQSAV